MPPRNFNPVYYGAEYLSLARVCREIGYRLDASYLEKGPSAYTAEIKEILPSLTTDLKSSEVRYCNPDPEKDLGEGIIIMRGEGDSSNPRELDNGVMKANNGNYDKGVYYMVINK